MATVMAREDAQPDRGENDGQPLEEAGIDQLAFESLHDVLLKTAARQSSGRAMESIL
jgi:hypothetical protein